MSPRFVLVAGEVSGDILAAALIEALRERFPQASFCGIAGPRMRAAGCEAWWSIDELSVMGLVEVLKHLPRLLKLRAQLVDRVLQHRPDAYIGIDAPDFNLGVESRLRSQGVRTVHYVSPSVWAWRRYRVRKIRRAVDLMLTVFPFEEAFYASSGVPAKFIGHPLADALVPEPPLAARERLGLAVDRPVIALLPGSRRSEVSRLIAPFAGTAQWLAERRSQMQFVLPAASGSLRRLIEDELKSYPGLTIRITDEGARDAMTAADVVLLASGTAALEAMLLERPMVVAYRLHPLSYALVSRLLSVEFFSLPNLLLGARIVPEFTQQDVAPGVLGPELLRWLDSPERRAAAISDFRSMHQRLAIGAARRGAAAVQQLLEGLIKAGDSGPAS